MIIYYETAENGIPIFTSQEKTLIQKADAGTHANRRLVLVSSCLVGLRTRYDGQVMRCEQCLDALARAIWIPVCPEQLGGLATPREPADLVDGDGFMVLDRLARVVTRTGKDVTEHFLTGAQQVLAIAQSLPVDGVFLKTRSPSCGVSPQMGVTAALLKRHGFEITEF